MNTIKSNTFCVRPFSSLYIATDGSFKFCCADTHVEIPRKFNITNTNLLELWNSSYHQKIRYELLNNIVPKSCKAKCFHTKHKEEFMLVKPRRLLDEHNQRKLILGNLNQNTSKDFTPIMSLEPIISIELSFSNKCNLKCRMCSPKFSDQLYDEWNSIPHVTKIDYTSIPDWTESIDAWNNIFNFLEEIVKNNPNQVVNFILSGGEPLINEGMYRFFDLALDKGLCKNIAISYNTNLTVLPKKLIDYWYNFKSIKLSISCDGYDKVNEYIRYPSKWSKLLSNLDILKSINKPNLTWNFIATAQIYNISNLIDLDNWVTENSKKLYIYELVFPTYLSIRALPMDIKLSIIDSWKNQNINRDWLKNIIIYMLSKDQSS